MKTLSLKQLDHQEITWVEPGQEVPMMQGMALQRLAKEFPTKQSYRQGWFLYSPTINHDPLGLPEACYYLIERKVRIQNPDATVLALVAFQEQGVSIEGKAIFH